MPTERWNRLDRLFREALEQPLDLRADFLGHACGADLDLRGEVESLLKAAAAPGDFLSIPAIDVFALQISREGWSVQPGDRIGSYTLDQRLGVGGMGEVWRGRDERLDRDVAIKVLLPGPSANVERVRALQHEARAAGTLNHRNVLTVYDVGEHRGVAYLVTECLEGESLRHRLGAGRLSTGEALDIALQVARGLDAAHRRGIVHRDLKPENVFVLQDGGVKLLDFGLATLHERSAVENLASGEVPGETSLRLVAGTAGYMAPEQLHGESVDARADVFALGAVLQEMLTGQRPFAGNATPATPSALLQLEPPEISSLSSEIPPELSDVVRRCLAESPSDRFASAAEVESALLSENRAAQAPKPPDGPSPPGRVGNRASRRPRPLRRGLALARRHRPCSLGTHRCSRRDTPSRGSSGNGRSFSGCASGTRGRSGRSIPAPVVARHVRPSLGDDGSGGR